MADAQVTAWLRCAGLSRFAPRFGAACVSSDNFLQLSPTDLDALGVDGPADRKRLSDLIAELRRATALPSQRYTPPRSSTLLSVASTHQRPVLETLSRNDSRNPPTDPPSTKRPSPRDPQPRSMRRLSSKAALAAVPATPARDPSPSPHTASGPRVTVCVRKRPLSRKELATNNRDIITVNHQECSLFVHELKEKVDLTKYVDTHPFTFDSVFNENVGNAAVYEGTARPLVDTLFAGGRGTCFAYGQTGAGKTFTMAGDGLENPGLYTLAVRDVFDRIRLIEREQWLDAEERGIEDFEPPDLPQVWISFYEIYASKLQDLLNRSGKLDCREDSNNEVQIVGLTERLCEVEEDVLACIDEGSASRATGITGANDDSSRSHAVFQIELRHPPSTTGTKDVNAALRESLLRPSRAPVTEGTEGGTEIGRLCFIDLAGSERGSDTASSTRQTRMEGAEINKSLLALKECIRAMDKRKDHTPFRGSKLTQVLKASFMGKNCRTVMIANISPASCNVEHTLNTLRYSDRVKEIKRERGGTSGVESGKTFGGRRATFSHGLGVRSLRTSGTPLSSRLSQPLSDSEFPDMTPPEPPATERKAPRTQDRFSDVDEEEQSSLGLPHTISRRRVNVRPRARPSDASALFPTNTQSEVSAAPKTRESRVTGRRRPSKAPSMIPSRPSLGGSMLPKPPSSKPKNGPEERVRRSNSGLRRRSSQAASFPVPDNGPSFGDAVHPDSVSNPDAQGKPPIAAAPSGVMTRRKAREMQAQAQAEEAKKAAASMEIDREGEPSQGSDEAERERAPRKRAPGSRNVAQSAKKYYMTSPKDELSDEDLLFISADDLVSAVSAATEDKKDITRSSVDGVAATKFAGLTETSTSVAEPTGKARTSQRRRSVASLCEDGSPDRSFSSDKQTDNGKVANESLKSVIRLHHMQIEELMRLTESDVALVNAVERGEMDSQEYALKLGVNLSQKMDIIRTLQQKAKQLE